MFITFLHAFSNNSHDLNINRSFPLHCILQYVCSPYIDSPSSFFCSYHLYTTSFIHSATVCHSVILHTLSFLPLPCCCSWWTPPGQTGGWSPCQSLASLAGSLLTTWRERSWDWREESHLPGPSPSTMRRGRLRGSSRGGWW